MSDIVNETVKTEVFSKSYPFINKYVIENGDFLASRYGDTREVIDFSTKITNPIYRCVGNNERDINIFFLIAEALWIFRGMKDVETLKIFNSRMTEFSDDGVNFHAPYGFRLRHHGVSSFDKKLPYELTEENKHAAQIDLEGLDQIEVALNLLKESPETRRAVLQIWNSDLDLGTNSKDLPCNDLVMIKIRDGEFRTTIANRSNDLHWGLPTNLFQFSFVTEIMARIINVELGTQTHNSQSLHVYTDNPIAFDMYDSIQITDGKFVDLYDEALPFEMIFNFKSESISGRLKEIDEHIDIILDACRTMKWINEATYKKLIKFCPVFALFYDLLKLYVEYKFNSDRSEKDKVNKLKELIYLSEKYPKYDIICLAQNFFYSKIKDRLTIKPLESKMIISSKL